MLIDADEIIEYLDHECEYYAKKYMRFMKDYDMGFHDAIDCVQRKIKNAPTIEAEPVRHGRWIPVGYDGYADGLPVYDEWECSECRFEVEGEGEQPLNYCPNCGFKMDGGDEDGEC